MTTGSSALYPLYGALFIVQHNLIMAQMFRNMLKFMGISAVFLFLLYTRGWSLQMALLAPVLGRGWLGQAAMQALLASEAALALYALLERVLAGNTDQLFDKVLALRGCAAVEPVQEADRQALQTAAGAVKLKDDAATDRWSRSAVVGWLMRLPLSAAKRALTSYSALVTAPLLAIPLVGWAAYLFLNGRATGASVHAHYFRRKGIKDSRQQQLIVHSRELDYLLFGCVAFVLNLVPILNFGFYYANAVGAALWAADLEASRVRLFESDGNSYIDEARQAVQALGASTKYAAQLRKLLAGAASGTQISHASPYKTRSKAQ